MNILVLSWRDPKHPMAGGAEQVMHEHMKGWVTAGHTVTLFSSEFKGGKKQETLDGISVLRRGSQLLGVQIMAFFWYLFSKHRHFDLVVDQFHGLPFFTPLYAQTARLAVLQEVAREVWLLNHLPKPLNWIVGWMGYLTEPLFFLFYKDIMFMTGSVSAKEDLVKFGIQKKNVSVVPHGVIIDVSSKKPTKEKTKTICFLGALARDKGIEDAIKAFGILNKEGAFNFWVLGSGAPEYVSFLKTLARSLGLGEKIKFFGFVSQKEKFNRLARAHVLINPSIREGWGLVNIEANRMGTPVAAYRSAGLIDSVNNNKSGLLCAQNTPSELAGIILRIFNENDLYKKLSKGAVDWSKRFSWDKSCEASNRLILKAVKRGL